MRAAGCEIVVDAKELAVVGITEILSRLPKILRLYRKLIRAADERPPVLAVVIDAPVQLARARKCGAGNSVVYYVCPQFWPGGRGASSCYAIRRQGPAIFPFEEKFYRDREWTRPCGTSACRSARAGDFARAYAAANQLDPGKAWITLMQHRRKEVRMNLPTILEAAHRLEADRPGADTHRSGRRRGLRFLLRGATLDASFLRN